MCIRFFFLYASLFSTWTWWTVKCPGCRVMQILSTLFFCSASPLVPGHLTLYESSLSLCNVCSTVKRPSLSFKSHPEVSKLAKAEAVFSSPSQRVQWKPKLSLSHSKITCCCGLYTQSYITHIITEVLTQLVLHTGTHCSKTEAQLFCLSL